MIKEDVLVLVTMGTGIACLAAALKRCNSACEMVQEGRILQTDSPAEVKKKYPELFGQYTQRSFYSVLKWAFQYVQNIDNNLGSIVGSMLNQKPAAARKLLRVGCRCLALLSAPSSTYTIPRSFLNPNPNSPAYHSR